MLKAGAAIWRSSWRARLRMGVVVFALALLVNPGLAGASARADNTLAVTSTTLPAATQGVFYEATLLASGGSAPYTWSILTGAVPLGLVLNSAGMLSGYPASAGNTTIELRVTDATGYAVTASIELDVVPAPPPPQQVVTVTSNGLVTLTGHLSAYSMSAHLAPDRIVGVAASPVGSGSWLVSARGEIEAINGAVNYGGLPVNRHHAAVVGITANASGTGYWMVTRDGHVFGFGAARSFGSLKRFRDSSAVVAIARSGRGYLLLERSGRVTGFGSARVHGSIRARRKQVDLVGIAGAPVGGGYWIAASNGQVFAFGSARAYHLSGPTPSGTVVGIATAPVGVGYYLIARDGSVFSYGSALPVAPVAVHPLDPVVGIGAAS